MTEDAALDTLARRAGVHPSFRDMTGTEQWITPETQRALLAANGLAAGNAAEVRDSLAMLDAEAAARLVPEDVIIDADTPNALTLEPGAHWAVRDEEVYDTHGEGQSAGIVTLPALAVGVYLLEVSLGDRQQTATLLVKPAHAPSVAQIAGAERQWGVVAALYALKSARNAGVGDYVDLRDLCAAFGAQGAAFAGINPIHALGWESRDVTSPYSPTHRGFLNALHIATDAQAPPAASGPMLDYAAQADVHRPALIAQFEAFERAADPQALARFDAFRQAEGAPLEMFAAFEALSQTHGPDARAWPVPLQKPSVGVASADPDAVRFHLWLQWMADTQVRAAQSGARQSGMPLGLYLDLAVGARLGGAEFWANANARAEGVSIGAPPDNLSPAGQNWGLCAYSPRKLTATRYAALRQVLRQNMRHCGILRIDHALGLNRSFWIPLDGTPGGYITMPFEALLAIVSIEAWQAGTVVVGEDLGLVPEGFRDRIEDAGLYGYTVLQFERDEAGRFREADTLRPKSLACFGTHDTATLRGFWEGCDIGWWRQLGWIREDEEPQTHVSRAKEKRDLIGLSDATDTAAVAFEDVQNQVHKKLAVAPTALAAVQLDDLLGLREAQNLPGTVSEHPNWQRRYPVDTADLAGHPALTSLAQQMYAARRGAAPADDERTKT